ncbi:MAG: sulfatase-like hydrolase/transferase, partial [Luteitalea sp.]|nr:sulfatase-like hydrolase/transferase [Luteitalea sp.]
MTNLRNILALTAATAALLLPACGRENPVLDRPNVLFAISDDQSYPHASAYGFKVVSTPAFDRVAREGVLFENFILSSPGCSPSRAALLTGRHAWQLEHAGTHASSFSAKYVVFPDLLEQAGYWVGYTGKGWGPGRWQDERPRNPAGPEFSELQNEPLAIRWASRVEPGRVAQELLGAVDLTATILEAAGVEPPQEYPIAGRSLMDVLEPGRHDPVAREHVFSARERHSSSRYDNLGYPQRAIRTRQYLYIRNFAPDRWPAGAPQKYDDDNTLGPMHDAYHDIDASPSLTFLVENRAHPQHGRYLGLSVDKRPAEELFDIQKDPSCLDNLAV